MYRFSYTTIIIVLYYMLGIMEFAHIYHWHLAFCQLFEVDYPSC